MTGRQSTFREPNFLFYLLKALPAGLRNLELSANLLALQGTMEGEMLSATRRRLSCLSHLSTDWFLSYGHIQDVPYNDYGFDGDASFLRFVCGQGPKMVRSLRLGVISEMVPFRQDDFVFLIPEGIETADILLNWHYREQFGALLNFMYAVSLTLPDSLKHLRLRARERQCDTFHNGGDNVLDAHHEKLVESIFAKEGRTVDISELLYSK